MLSRPTQVLAYFTKSPTNLLRKPPFVLRKHQFVLRNALLLLRMQASLLRNLLFCITKASIRIMGASIHITGSPFPFTNTSVRITRTGIRITGRLVPSMKNERSLRTLAYPPFYTPSFFIHKTYISFIDLFRKRKWISMYFNCLQNTKMPISALHPDCRATVTDDCRFVLQ